MTDEATVCAAAFFRIRGKDVVTPKEFTMTVSLDLKWMPVKEADALADLLVERKAMTRSGGYLRPTEGLSTLAVPIAYRPSEAFRQEIAARLRGGAKPTKVPAAKAPAAAAGGDLFPTLVDLAVKAGVPKGKFIGECNGVKKKLGIDVCAAALIVLRDHGADAGELTEKVYQQLLVH